MLQDMLKHTKQLPYQVFAPLMSDIAQLHSVVQTGRALAYSMANIDSQFRNTFKGYSGWTPKQWYLDYRNWSDRSLDTMSPETQPSSTGTKQGGAICPPAFTPTRRVSEGG